MLRRTGAAIVASGLALLPIGVAHAADAVTRAIPPAASSPYRIRSFGGVDGCGPLAFQHHLAPGTPAVSVVVRGGAGGAGSDRKGGDPGLAVAAFNVSSDVLGLVVGCAGASTPLSTTGGAGGPGFGSGGAGGASPLASQGGGGGGGGSAVLEGDRTPIVVAAGGGGGGGGTGIPPGSGWGGPADADGAFGNPASGVQTQGGRAGSRTAAGAGGARLDSCCPGGDGVGWNGGAGGSGATDPIGGGGGGGGLFGGGGGEGGVAGTSVGAGGGGGSSVVPGFGLGYHRTTAGGTTAATRNGRVKIITMKPATRGPYWPGWDIARGVAVSPTGSGGYVLDGFGGIQPFASGNDPLPPAVSGSAYWPGWDIARGLALLPDGTGGVVLDGFGGLHPFGIGGHAAPSVTGTAYWPGVDIARAIAIQPDGTSGYVIDGYGGRHAISVNGSSNPGVWGYGQNSPDWPGFAIARGISIAFELHSESGTAVLGGYVSDTFGRIYPVGQEGPLGTRGSPTFGTAPAAGAPFWPTWAIARGIGAYPNGYGGYELDGFGGLHGFVFAGQP